MSDSTGVIAIAFVSLIGLWIGLYAGRQANQMGLQICTGVVDGTTVPPEVRWHMLFNMWVPYQSGGTMAAILIAASDLVIASLVGNEDVKHLGYLAAMLASVGSLFWVLTGIVIFINMRSVLRQAEAD